ncbi:MAG TPA: penicillin-binding protein 2 [Gaiellaceae bacterium]|nr:penicillin-binding protein 2 [Gaiellaceae bacterium]
MASTPAGRFLPRDPRVEEPYRLTPQLALRIGILGAITLAVFGILFFRLWALQVLSGTQYLRAARNNQLRTIRVEAPRGAIVDREGRMLVDNKQATAIQIVPADLPRRGLQRQRELRRLSGILDVPYARVARDLRRQASNPLANVTVKAAAREDEVAYLLEHENELPGVQIAATYIRHYPFQSLAAHVLGYVGEINPDQLKRLRKRGYELGDKIGQGGVEATYDTYLRGQPGRAQLRVDSMGRPRSSVIPMRAQKRGYSLRLTIDIQVQRAAEQALREAIAYARTQDCKGCWMANGGAIVAIDPRNGEIRALASNPTFQPRVYAGQPNPRELGPLMNQRKAEQANFPGVDRVTQGLYPPGSTFKPVTALAAMQEHVLSPYSTLPCTSTYTAGRDKQVFRNWMPMDAAMTLPTALGASCDTYFYYVGDQFYKLPPERGQPLQAWAKRLGFGSPTGIDVGSEAGGLLPTIKWKRETFKSEIDKLWKPGDSIQLAIGQKDLLVTPLQMATFYSFIANGGKVVKPHVASRVEEPTVGSGQPIVRRSLSPSPPRSLNVDPGAIAAIRDGLYKATHESYGTAASVFGAFPIPIAGKTGTAEKARDLGGYVDLVDQSWFCGYGPTNEPELVVCAVIENGGFGGAVAAPATAKVFAKYFGIESYVAQAKAAD